MRRILGAGIAALPLVVAGSALAQQPPRSIVGTWTEAGKACTREAGALTIGPMSLEGEDVSCRFKTVKRQGNTVEWTGTCADAEGESRQTVRATESNAKLTIRYVQSGNVIDNLIRCR